MLIILLIIVIFVPLITNTYNKTMKKQNFKPTIEIKYNSNIAKILRGETKGYNDWYIKSVMQEANRIEYIIVK